MQQEFIAQNNELSLFVNMQLIFVSSRSSVVAVEITSSSSSAASILQFIKECLSWCLGAFSVQLAGDGEFYKNAKMYEYGNGVAVMTTNQDAFGVIQVQPSIFTGGDIILVIFLMFLIYFD